MSIKQKAYQFCEDYIFGRLQRIKINIEEINASLNSETKSSAGDKHETGRAMLQLEREKLGRQLLEAEKTAKLLQKVKTTKQGDTAILGSLINTNTSSYYIAISAGKFEFNGQDIYCISANTPIGKLLMNKTQGDIFTFNKIQHKILKVS